jgi:hypothetical protein
MKDASLKTTQYTIHDAYGDPHTVKLIRIPGAPRCEATETADIDMSDRGLNRYVNTATPNEKALITEVVNLRIKLSRQRPVVLDLEESEAALLLDLLHEEVDALTVKADVNYQNGSGYEAECAQAREAERAAEKVADRLRKILGKHLDKAYAGEL